MALESTEKSILEDGIFSVEDLVIGKRVSGLLSKKDHPFRTEEGLDICRMSCFEDNRIQAPIESFFERPGLGLLKAYSPNPENVFAFLTNLPNESNIPADQRNQGKNKVKVLLIQLFETNSIAMFYKRSHLYALTNKDAGIGLLDIAPESLEQKGIKPFEVNLKEGGFAIIDGRLGFKWIQGRTIIAGFATEDEVKSWTKMEFPKTDSVVRKIEEMVSGKIRMNYIYTEGAT